MLIIEALPAFQDNYIWLIRNPSSHRCAVVDPGDAAPVLRWLQQHSDWRLSEILITHHHADHTGGIAALTQATGARVLGPAREAIPQRALGLDEGANVQVLDTAVSVLAVPGHTLGHIAYVFDDPDGPLLFCGDTLFAGGCGRLFEGTPEQMHDSLQRLAALPPPTKVYCAHEYTVSNLRFAAAVEPYNQIIETRLSEAQSLRTAGRITLPSTIELERATNPFLRLHDATLRSAAAAHGAGPSASDSEIFAAIRAWKNEFR